MSDVATLSLLPWVRQGAASAITTDDDLTPGQSGVAEVAAALTLNNTHVPPVPVQLRGPADVLGIDTNQVVRTDPRPGSVDFESNCFPSIEFDRPDFPWLFTPLRANVAKQQLRPWLCLVVVRKQPGVTLTSSGDSPLSSLQIAAPADPAAELPDLNDSWGWAHAQVAADATQIQAALMDAPKSLSRLVCPRILVANTDYIACVVPTFEIGRQAGLGSLITNANENAAPTKIDLTPAWSLLPKPPTQVLLPVFYHWEFRTGPGGNFKLLALNLRPGVVPDGLGTRKIDISHPGFRIMPPPPSMQVTAGSVELEGVLLPIPTEAQKPSDPNSSASAEPSYSVPQEFQNSLAQIINEPSLMQTTDPKADPLLAPPIYGQWHAAIRTVTPEGTTWLDELNLDPRWRVAAAFGTRVIQQHQEALMASAWEQAAELATANQRMRQLQMSMAIGESLHKRHFSRFSEEMTFRVPAPAFGRLRLNSGAPEPPKIGPPEPPKPGPPLAAGKTLLAMQASSPLPFGANRSAMRRIGRPRSALSRRIAQNGPARGDTWVALLHNKMQGAPPPSAPPPSAFSPYPSLPTPDDLNHFYFGAFFVAPENTPVPSPGAQVESGNAEVPGFFRQAALDHMPKFFISRIPIERSFAVWQSHVTADVLDAMHPQKTLRPLAKAVVTLGENVLAPTAPGVTSVGVETIMAAPSFPQPMYEPLRDISQELLLPGLETVKPNTVLALETNRRFLEAYMVGLNHEMGRELLWRGYPTDQRGTYFKQFWDKTGAKEAQSDIVDLNTWQQRQLGQPPTTPLPEQVQEQFVLLIRSNLLQRYPNAVIYLTPAIQSPQSPSTLEPDTNLDNEVLPIFRGSMQPDVTFFGFPVTADDAIRTHGGYYVVIQEHPTEPRFGLDVSNLPSNASHLAIGKNPATGLPLSNAAEVAAATLQHPFRILFHASRLIGKASQ
jgi:hypothetical protein